jgi:predicted acyl esterase
LTIAGPISVDLTGSTSGTDCDWIVKVIDVFPDTMSNPYPNPTKTNFGGYQMLIRGDVLRGKFRNSRSNPEPIVPDKPSNFRFTLQDVLHRFQPGHRMMVQIQSSWFPMIDRNPGTFLDIYHANNSDFHPTVQRVYHSKDHPSSIIVNVLN